MSNLEYFKYIVTEAELTEYYDMELLDKAIANPTEHMDYIRDAINETRYIMERLQC